MSHKNMEESAIKSSVALAPFTPSDRLRMYTAVEIAEMCIVEPTQYWGRHFAKGRLIMVYGWRGVGKSHFILCVAISMATGAKFLGYAPEEPLKVVILDGEMDLCTLKKRLVRTNRSLRVEPTHNLRFLSPEMFAGAMPSIINSEGQQEIDEALGEDWDVLIIDNYAAFSSGREDGEAWGPCSKWLMKHRRAGRTVIMVHHSGKNGRQRGASNHEDAMDVSISISAPPKKSVADGALQFVLKWEKSRHLSAAKTRSMLVSYRKNDQGRWRWSKSYDLNYDPSHAKAIEMVRKGLTQTEIARELGVNKSTISRLLSKERLKESKRKKD